MELTFISHHWKLPQSWTKVLRHLTETIAFKVTIIFCVWMKIPFSSVILPPFPQPVLQTPRGCLFVSNIEKGGRETTFHEGRGENSHQGKKGWCLSCVSMTFVHDCTCGHMTVYGKKRFCLQSDSSNVFLGKCFVQHKLIRCWFIQDHWQTPTQRTQLITPTTLKSIFLFGHPHRRLRMLRWWIFGSVLLMLGCSLTVFWSMPHRDRVCNSLRGRP